MGEQEREVYADFAAVEMQKKFLVPEEFPEGAYGEPFQQNKPVEGKQTPSHYPYDQQTRSAFTYENRALHAGVPRQMEGAHPTHDSNGDTNIITDSVIKRDDE